MQNVLVTGVSGGIGRRLASLILANGGSVVGFDKVLGDEIKELAEQNRKKLVLKEIDLMDIESLGLAVKNIVDEFGPIGGFVHCAGYDKMAPLHMTKVEDLENLWCIHALVPMVLIATISKKRNHSENTAIVLISSQSAHEGAMGHTAYAAAKGAIEGYLAPAAAELSEKGIRINEVCFAPIKTKMSESWIEKLTPEGKEKLLADYPMGLGEVDDAAKLIYFLLSQDSRFINGQIITADGGHAVRKV